MLQSIVTHKTYTQEKIMFNQVIDAIQDGKKQIVNTFVKDESFKTELTKLVDAQTKFAKGSVQSTLDIAQSFVKNASNAFYKKA
jgi:hypothetical protein